MNRSLQRLLPYYVLIIITFLISFRASVSVDDFPDYALPGFLMSFQLISLPLVILLMLISILGKFKDLSKSLRKGWLAMVTYFIFHFFVLIGGSEMGYTDLFSRLTFLCVVLFYAFMVLRNLDFYENSQPSIIHAVWIGLLGFIVVNVLIYLTGIGNVMQKGRLYGVTPQPNFLGVCCAIEVALSFFLLSREKKYWVKGISFFAMALSVWVCILTGSRNAELSSLLSVTLISIFSIRNLRTRYLIVLLSLLSMALLLSLVNLSALDTEGRGNTRKETWSELINGVAAIGFLGKGRQGATTNGFLFAIVASGLVGCLFFYYSFLRLFKNAFQNLNFEFSQILIYRTLLLLLCFASLFEGFLLDTASVPVLIFWILLSNIES